MGLLDDAIKEHLELKRRRGADPGEIARAEQEALGHVRRGEVDLAERAGSTATAEAPPTEPELAEPDVVELVAAEPPPAPVSYELPPEPEPEPEPVAFEPAAPEPPAATEPRVEEAATGASPFHGDPLADEAIGPHDVQPTAEFAAQDYEEATGGGDIAPPAAEPDEPATTALDPDVVPADTGEEDELAETPEFLQETPEHDRLWFEQKPPKDFDF